MQYLPLIIFPALVIAYEVLHALADRDEVKKRMRSPLKPNVQKVIVFDRLGTIGLLLFVFGFAHASMFVVGLLIAVVSGMASGYFKRRAMMEREAVRCGFDLIQR